MRTIDSMIFIKEKNLFVPRSALRTNFHIFVPFPASCHHEFGACVALIMTQMINTLSKSDYYFFKVILGLMVYVGVGVSLDIYAWVIVVVLPINSALNPFIYTFSMIYRQKTRRRKVPSPGCPTK